MSVASLKCLVFDFDGTLADTLELSLRIYNELAVTHGLRSIGLPDLPALRRMQMTEFFQFCECPAMRVPKILAEGKRIAAASMHSVRPIEGLPELLPTLREHFPLMGILTSNSQENVHAFLDTHGVNCFDFVHSSSRLTGKCRHIRALLKRYELEPHELVYVGDETRDIKAARKAGVVAAAVGWGFNCIDTLRDMAPDIAVDLPRELVAHLGCSAHTRAPVQTVAVG